MSCTVFKSTNTVDQSINVFPIKDMISQVRVLRNPDSATPNKYEFYYPTPTLLKCVGGKFSTDGGLTYVTEANIGGGTNFIFMLDDGRDYAYIAWNNTNSLQGKNIGSGAYPDYSLGLHCENAQVKNICANSPLFNQPVNLWDLKNALSLEFAFIGCSSFNRNITNWNTSSARSFKGLFQDCSKFNQDLSSLDSSNVYDFSLMLKSAYSFNKPLNFDMSNGLHFGHFLNGAKSFNQDLSSLNTSKAIEMQYFIANSDFNAPFLQYTAKVQTFFATFAGCSKFNQPLNIDVSSCKDFTWMFNGASAFNQDISNWNVKSGLIFTEMFMGALAFDQDLSKWCNKFNINADISRLFASSSLSVSNYDKFLNALWLDVGTTRAQEWANRTASKILQSNGLKYSQDAANARNNLVGAGWTITDGGQS